MMAIVVSVFMVLVTVPAMILGTLLDELERRGASTGLATLCVGAGMGTATDTAAATAVGDDESAKSLDRSRGQLEAELVHEVGRPQLQQRLDRAAYVIAAATTATTTASLRLRFFKCLPTNLEVVRRYTRHDGRSSTNTTNTNTETPRPMR